jgi:hypothetical protein
MQGLNKHERENKKRGETRREESEQGKQEILQF